jgi:hypothetical protein
MKRYLEFAGGAVERIEAILFAFAAAVLVAAGPPIWCYRLVVGHHATLAVAICSLWLVSVGAITVEVRNKALTAVSLGLVLTWLMAMAYVFHDAIFRIDFLEMNLCHPGRLSGCL